MNYIRKKLKFPDICKTPLQEKKIESIVIRVAGSEEIESIIPDWRTFIQSAVEDQSNLDTVHLKITESISWIQNKVIQLDTDEIHMHTLKLDHLTKMRGKYQEIICKLQKEIAKWEEELSSIGEDAQLTNIDLQNSLQKQQQTMQAMSSVSKTLHDTAMGIVRKVG